jgi:hypothetical protein
VQNHTQNMQLHINITDESKAIFLLELLRSLDYVQLIEPNSEDGQAQKETLLQSKGIDYDDEFVEYSVQELANTIISYQKQQKAEEQGYEENWDWLNSENSQTA